MVYSANYNFGIDEGKNRKNKMTLLNHCRY